MDVLSNQYGCGAGLVLQTPSDEQIEYVIRIGFNGTNNKVEYVTLLAGLRVASELGVKSLETFSDSQLIVNQVQGDYLVVPKDKPIGGEFDFSNLKYNYD